MNITRSAHQIWNLTQSRFLLFTFLLAFTLRLLYAVFVIQLDTHPGVDGVFYNMVAVNMTRDVGFAIAPHKPTAKKPPIYIGSLAAIYQLFGRSYTMVRLVQSFVSAATILLLYAFGRRLGGEALGRGAALLLAINPLHIYLAGWFLSQTYYLVLTLAAAYCLQRAQSGPRPFFFCASAGAMLGLASLTISYSTPVFYLFTLIWAVITFAPSWKRVLMAWSGLMLAMLLVISTWTVRNWVVFEEFIPIATNGGIRFWGANNDRASGVWIPWSGSARFYFSQGEPGWGEATDWVDWANQAGSPWLNLQFATPDGCTPKELNDRYYAMGRKWIMRNPGKYLRLIPRKIGALFQYFHPLTTLPRPLELWWFRSKWIGAAIYYPSMLLAAIGLWGIRHRLKEYRVVLLMIAHTILGSMLFFGDAGQRAPITPYLIILTVLGAQFLLTRFSSPLRDQD